MNNISHYAKPITYIAIAAMAFLVTALSDNQITGEELLNLVIVVLGAIGVYAIPNIPANVAKYAKTGVAFLTAGVIALLSFWTDGVTTAEWLQIIIAAFAAVGVYIVPNSPKDPVVQPVEVVAAAPEALGPVTIINSATPVTAGADTATQPVSTVPDARG